MIEFNMRLHRCACHTASLCSIVELLACCVRWNGVVFIWILYLYESSPVIIIYYINKIRTWKKKQTNSVVGSCGARRLYRDNFYIVLNYILLREIFVGIRNYPFRAQCRHEIHQIYNIKNLFKDQDSSVTITLLM